MQTNRKQHHTGLSSNVLSRDANSNDYDDDGNRGGEDVIIKLTILMVTVMNNWPMAVNYFRYNWQ